MTVAVSRPPSSGPDVTLVPRLNAAAQVTPREGLNQLWQMFLEEASRKVSWEEERERLNIEFDWPHRPEVAREA